MSEIYPSVMEKMNETFNDKTNPPTTSAAYYKRG